MFLATLTWETFREFWPHFVAVVAFFVDLATSAHAILNKRNTRAAIGWVAIIWLVPVVGFALYIWLGINRIHRKARRLLERQVPSERQTVFCQCDHQQLDEHLLPRGEPLRRLADLMHELTGLPLLHGNQFEPLYNGEKAYPAMLAAIDGAERSINLCTYIFDNDAAGQQFVAALGRAVQRGVSVRVLIDDIGARYHLPTVIGALEDVGVRVARFLPSLLSFSLRYSNLRNHRKVMVVDGRVGFTGGMNIRGQELRDLHFRATGPIVAQMQQVFVDDWAFTTNEVLDGEAWFPALEPVGPVLARGVLDGPDENLDKLRLTILGAIACAQRRITVMTPYFLPDDSAIITALNVASMRGVQVDIVLPAENNLRLVKWAMQATLWQVLERGCRVWYTPPPFDHSKVMVVDGAWSLIGSGNWDARSLRLNFEYNVECYDPDLAILLETQVQELLQRSRRVQLAELDRRPLWVRLRDGISRLFAPYL